MPKGKRRKSGRDLALIASLLGNVLLFVGKLPDLQKAIRESGLLREPVAVIRFVTRHKDLQINGVVNVATADGVQLLGTEGFETELTLPKQPAYKAMPRLQYLELPFHKAFRYASDPQVIHIDDTFSVTGQIVRKGADEGIAGAAISIDGKTEISDVRGMYFIEGLSPRTKYDVAVCLKGRDGCEPSQLMRFSFNPTQVDASLHTYNIQVPNA